MIKKLLYIIVEKEKICMYLRWLNKYFGTLLKCSIMLHN